MECFSLCKSFRYVPELTGKVAGVMRKYGLKCDQMREKDTQNKSDLRI